MRLPILALVLALGSEGLHAGDEYLYLPYDLDGFAPANARKEGDASGRGDSYDPKNLPEGRKLVIDSEAFGKVVFVRPKTTGSKKNLLSVAGQTVPIRTKSYPNVVFLLSNAIGQGQRGELRFVYEDGQSATAPVAFTGHTENRYHFEEAVLTLRYRSSNRTSSTTQTKFWLQAVPVPRPAERAGPRLTAVVLPELSRARLLGLSLGKRPGITAPPLGLTSRPTLPAADVAVLSISGFPSYKPSYSIEPLELVAALGERGLSAVEIGLEDLVDPEVFTRARYPVFVNLYGKAFPAPGLEAIRRYRQDGGRLLHTSVPLNHIHHQNVYGHWRDSSTSAHFGHDEGGLGVSGSRSALDSARLTPTEAFATLRVAGFPWARTQLEDDWLSSQSATRDGLAPAIHDEGKTRVTPLVSYGEEPVHYAALVEHQAGVVPGCMDLWTGTGKLLLDGRVLAKDFERELLLRLVLYLGSREGPAPEGEAAAAAETPDEALTAQRAREARFLKPFEALEPLALEDPAVAGKRFVPRRELTPAIEGERRLPEKLYVLSTSQLTNPERFLASSLQGLIARKPGGPRLFLARVKAHQAHPERIYRNSEGSPSLERRDISLGDALDLLGHRRAVVVDPRLYGSPNLATMVGALEDLVVAWPGHVERYGLEVKADLRGLFASSSEMFRFALEHLRPRLRQDRFAFYPPGMGHFRLRDVLVRDRVFIAWLPRWSRRLPQGAGHREQLALLEAYFASLPAQTPAFGSYGANSASVGSTLGRRLFARHGLDWIAGDDVNGTLFSSRARRRGTLEPEVKPAASPDLGTHFAIVLRPGSGVTRDAFRLPPPKAPTESTTDQGESGGTLPVAGFIDHPLRSDVTGAAPVRVGDAVGLELSAARTQLAILGAKYGAERDKLQKAWASGIEAQVEELGASFYFASVNSGGAALASLARELPGDLPLVLNATVGSPAQAHEIVEGRVVFRFLSTGAAQQLSAKAAKKGGPSYFLVDRVAFTSLKPALRARALSLSRLAATYRSLREHWRPADQRLVAPGARWSYHALGVDLAEAWRAPDYDDKDWAKGRARLGYGGDGEVTVVPSGADPKEKNLTTYFRRGFQAPKIDAETLTLRFQVDDGLIVWLNGEELHRFNVPGGKVGYTTRASSTQSSSGEKRWNVVNVPSKLLREGRNVLAVEVHQASSSSSDLGFDLALEVTGWERLDGGSAGKAVDPELQDPKSPDPESKPPESPDPPVDPSTATPRSASKPPPKPDPENPGIETAPDSEKGTDT